VYHLASYGNHDQQKYFDHEIFKANVLAVANLLEYGVGYYKSCKFYNFSSSSVNLPVQTMYSRTKKMGEMLIEQYKEKYGWDLFNIRPYSVFGPGEDLERFIPRVIKCILTGETMQVVENATHDWIYVDDFIKAIPYSTEIGTGIKTSNIEVIRIIEKIMNKKLNYQAVDNLRTYDNADWVCKEPLQVTDPLSLYEGLEKTVKFYTLWYGQH
jgi:nucleoside-diphosphate-sugar epimerase